MTAPTIEEPVDSIVVSEEDPNISTDAEPLDDSEVQSMVGQMVDDAMDYTDSELSPFRAKAIDYYHGRPYGDETEGRSAVVSRDVMEVVQSILPSLMRLFYGTEQMVEFRPRSEEDVPIAQQQTDYINYIIQEDNPGFMVLHAALKDALVGAQGVIKWYWEDMQTTESYRLTGVTEDQLLLLATDTSITASVVGQEEPEATENDEAAGQQPPTYVVDVTRWDDDGRAKIVAVPPEEFIFTPNARSIDEALCVCHRTRKRASDLIAMGIDPELIERNSGSGTSQMNSSEEVYARQPDRSWFGQDNAPQTQTEWIDYYEAYCYLDEDGDGIAENRRVVLIGSGKELVDSQPWSDRPFALFIPDPEQHTITGESPATTTMEVQLVKSHILRGMLDSLSFTLHPRTAIVEGQANMADVLNEEIGSVIRERAPGMVREFNHTFVGASAFPVLEYMDQQKEQNTGMSKASKGLDPDSLQSATRAAVAATISASQARVELIARVFAETGLQDLMKGLLKLVVQHQDQPRVIRLRNEYTLVDPRPWTADMDVTCNVAPGAMLTEERMQSLMLILQKQEAIIQQYGPNNPLVTIGQYRATLQKLIEISGYKNVDEFFKPVPIDFEPPPPEPKPTAEEVFAQTEQAKIQADMQKSQMKAVGDAAQLEFDYDELRSNQFLKAKEMEMKYSIEISNQVQQMISERSSDA